MDESTVRDMVAELRATLRATRAELSDALNVLAQIEQAVGYSDAHTTVALNAIAEYSAKLRLAGEDE